MLAGLERVDLFPKWNEGMQRLLRTFKIHWDCSLFTDAVPSLLSKLQ